MLRLLLLVLSAAAAFSAEEAVPTHLKVKASFTRLDKDGKPLASYFRGTAVFKMG